MTIGIDIPRVEGLSKLSGCAHYVDDLHVADLWHGGTVRSAAQRGLIKGVRFDPSINWEEFAIVDHRDIPARNEVALLDTDQPALAAREVRHKYEPVVLIAHRSMRKLREALQAVRVVIDPLPAVTDPTQSPTRDLIQYGDDNVFKRIDIRKGDPAPVFAGAPYVIEGEYRTGSQEHVYLETQGMLAHQEDGRMVVRGSMQCPYYVLDALTHLFGRPRNAFRVVPTEVGGGFGGKEEYPSLIAIHAALLCEKAGAPVKIVYDRHEDMACTTKRHPSIVKHRTAVDADGCLMAMEIDVILDGGAYVTLSPVVLSRGTIHSAGPYHCEHVHIHGEVRLTNAPPYGAFRGFGAPQTLFAVERHMDEIAKKLNMEPAEVRRRNLLRRGQQTATGQVVHEGADLVALMDRALDLGKYEERRRRCASENQSHPYLRRGVGLATFYHGAGFTGGGEVDLASEVWVEGVSDGTIEVLTAQTEMGQGASTVLTQVAADRLGLSPNRIRIAAADTSRVPNSGPTVASRTSMVVGTLVARACGNLVLLLDVDKGARGTSLEDAIRRWHVDNPSERLIGRATFTQPDRLRWNEKDHRGDAYACYSYAAHVAEVEVDLRTYTVRVTDYVAVQDIGRVINPTLARGQIQGGVAQGIGWTLYEDVILEEGAMKNGQMTNYMILTSADLPNIRVHFDETPSAYGPHGAKGVGELPMDGPAPTLLNAISRALGTSLSSIPLTPERLMEHLEED